MEPKKKLPKMFGLNSLKVVYLILKELEDGLVHRGSEINKKVFHKWRFVSIDKIISIKAAIRDMGLINLHSVPFDMQHHYVISESGKQFIKLIDKQGCGYTEAWKSIYLTEFNKNGV